MYSVYTYLIEELRHGNDVKGWFLTFATSHLMRSMNAEAVLKHRVRNKQTSGQKNRRQKVFLFFIFFQPICKFSGRSDKLLAAGAKEGDYNYLLLDILGGCPQIVSIQAM